MILNVHAGHSLICRGASAILDEVDEDRKVKNAVINYLRQQGHTVYDCTDDSGRTQRDNLSAIVRNCNTHTVDYDVSIHLNSGRNDYTGDGSIGGVEVYGFDNGVAGISNRICNEISDTLGITNRGFKINKGLYVLSSTKAPALLIECCFVDDKDDAARWNADNCAKAIVKGITGAAVNHPENETEAKLKENEYNKKSYIIAGKAEKMYGFRTIKPVTVRVAPNDKADIITTIPSGSNQGINQITKDGWGHLANNAGWILLKGYCTAINSTGYELKASEAAVRETASGKSRRVATLKKGSRQPICFIASNGFGLISNFAGWVNLKAFKKI